MSQVLLVPGHLQQPGLLAVVAMAAADTPGATIRDHVRVATVCEKGVLPVTYGQTVSHDIFLAGADGRGSPERTQGADVAEEIPGGKVLLITRWIQQGEKLFDRGKAPSQAAAKK